MCLPKLSNGRHERTLQLDIIRHMASIWLESKYWEIGRYLVTAELGAGIRYIPSVKHTMH